MPLQECRLKKNSDRRLRAGHVWIYSNEIATPLQSFTLGEIVNIRAANGDVLGTATLNPHTLLAGRLISRSADTLPDRAFFAERLKSALTCRNHLFKKPFYRLAFGESDALPGLVIDRYGDHLVAQLNTAGMDRLQDALVAALREILPDTKSLLLRNDSPIRSLEKCPLFVQPAFGEPPEQVQISENNILFRAALQGGQKTGWFYDHRLNRARLQDYVKKSRVLDVFSYLGAFGIHAACYGADSVICVDASPLSAEGIRLNARLNQVEDKVSVLTMDAFDALKQLHQAGEQFDVIILDPPAFVKKQKDLAEGLMAYQRLNAAALKCLAPSGFLMSCSCSMQVSFADFQTCLHRAAWQKGHAGFRTQFIERGHQGPDHPVHPAIPETDYLKMVMVRKEMQVSM